MRERLIGLGIVLTVIVTGIGSCITVVEGMPDNALVVIANGEYFPALPGFLDAYRLLDPNAHEVTVAEARAQKYPPNETFREGGHFDGNEQSLLRAWLESVGLIKAKTRWNEDGTWRY